MPADVYFRVVDVIRVSRNPPEAYNNGVANLLPTSDPLSHKSPRRRL